MEMLLVPWVQIVLAREIIPAWLAKICKRCSSLTPRWWHLCFSSIPVTPSRARGCLLQVLNPEELAQAAAQLNQGEALRLKV